MNRLVLKIFSLLVTISLLTGCLQNAPPTLKIGLVAPFEGLDRSLGYEALFAVKLALQERNEQGLAGYRVELVALNDFNDPMEAEVQAGAIVADPDVLGVVGHLTAKTTLEALPIYQAAGLALSVPWSISTSDYYAQGMVSIAATRAELSAYLESFSQDQGLTNIVELRQPGFASLPPAAEAIQFENSAVIAGEIILALAEDNVTLPMLGQVDVGSPQLPQVARDAADGLFFVSPGPAPEDIFVPTDFVDAYQSLAGFPPGPRAVLAYDATHVLLDAIELAMLEANRQPTRADVSAVIATIQRNGLSGRIAFDEKGRRIDAPIWIYQISEEQYPGVMIVHN